MDPDPDPDPWCIFSSNCIQLSVLCVNYCTKVRYEAIRSELEKMTLLQGFLNNHLYVPILVICITYEHIFKQFRSDWRYRFVNHVWLFNLKKETCENKMSLILGLFFYHCQWIHNVPFQVQGASLKILIQRCKFLRYSRIIIVSKVASSATLSNSCYWFYPSSDISWL